MSQYEEMDDDPEYYEKIRFSFIPFKKSNEGGTDEHNDCLINCIRKFCPKKIIDHGKLKTHLNLNRDDPIPIDKVKDLEQYINQYETQHMPFLLREMRNILQPFKQTDTST